MVRVLENAAVLATKRNVRAACGSRRGSAIRDMPSVRSAFPGVVRAASPNERSEQHHPALHIRNVALAQSLVTEARDGCRRRAKLGRVRPLNAETVLSDALELASSDRARVAAALLASLDEGRDDDADQAWAAEIDRRAERVLSGDSEGAPWETVRARLVARLQRS